LPKGRAYLADQLRRAATSIALNIAEGAGEFAAREKARFYRMARRSATECGAVLDVCARLGLGGAAQRLATGKALVHRIVSMLTVLVKRLGVLDSAGTGTGTGARERGEARSGRGTGTGTFTGGGDSWFASLAGR
jgi:four helix bundle protein